MLSNGAEICRHIGREKRHFVLLAEKIKSLLADRKAVHLGLTGAPEDVRDRKA